MNQLKKGGLLSYINLAITNILGIVITPFVIRSLGDSEYGLFALIGAFVGYLTVLDLGLTNAIVRFVAQYRAQGNRKEQENFLAVSFIIYFFISIIVIGGGLVMYFNVQSLFGASLTSDQMEKAKIMLLIFVFNIAIAVPGGAFVGICNGYEQFVFPKSTSIIKYLLRSVLVVVILTKGADALGLVVLDSILNVLLILSNAYYVFFILKVKVKLHSFESKFVKEIFSYSIWVFVFGLVYQFQWRTGQIILGTTTDTSTVAIFAVGVTLGLYFLTFGNVINGLILPKAVQSIYNKSSNEVLTQQMIRVSRISMILLFYILGGFIILGKEFIQLWVGTTYEQSWLVALLIMVAYIMPISQGYAHAILEAKKLMRFKSLTSLILTLLGFVLGGYLSKYYGINGIILGIFSALIVLQFILLVYYQVKLRLDMKKYFTKALFPFLLFFAVVCSASFYLVKIFDQGWLYLALKMIIYSIIFVLGAIILLKKEEKNLMINFFNKNKA